MKNCQTPQNSTKNVSCLASSNRKLVGYGEARQSFRTSNNDPYSLRLRPVVVLLLTFSRTNEQLMYNQTVKLVTCGVRQTRYHSKELSEQNLILARVANLRNFKKSFQFYPTS